MEVAKNCNAGKIVATKTSIRRHITTDISLVHCISWKGPKIRELEGTEMDNPKKKQALSVSGSVQGSKGVGALRC